LPASAGAGATRASGSGTRAAGGGVRTGGFPGFNGGAPGGSASVGTVSSVNGTFRSVLDAALSSPTGRGVIVDEHGRLAGTITAANVVRLLEKHPTAQVTRS